MQQDKNLNLFNKHNVDKYFKKLVKKDAEERQNLKLIRLNTEACINAKRNLN